MEYLKYRSYQIIIDRKAKNRNIYFRINTDGSLAITCPLFVKNKDLISYLDKFIDKIEKKYNQESLNKLDYQDGGNFYYLGQRYLIEYCFAKREYCQLVVTDQKLQVYTNDFALTNIKKIIDNFIKKEATKLLQARFALLCDSFIHIDFKPQLKIRKMTSKFGVCYYKKAAITLSSLLIHYDYDCIDYVIIHELVHFIQPNHSKKFYYLLEQYLPNYKEIQNKLKNINIES